MEDCQAYGLVTSFIHTEECQVYGLVTAMAGTRVEREEELVYSSEEDHEYEVINA